MLNHVAARLERPVWKRAPRLLAATLFASFFASFAVPSPAAAIEGIDLSSPPEQSTIGGECSRLVRIKYPFIRCSGGEIGQSGVDENWGNTRQIPIGSDFVEGNGYFGDELNSD